MVPDAINTWNADFSPVLERYYWEMISKLIILDSIPKIAFNEELCFIKYG